MGLMKIAYCDESADPRPPKVFVVSGYLGTAPDWFELGRRWRAALKSEGFMTTAFHMSKCEYGDPPYDTMDRDARDRLQRRFIDIIVDTPLNGFASAIELAYYNEIIHDIERSRDVFHKPYYLAFQATVELMSNVLDNAGFPREECIAFVFDQHQEFQGKAKELYDSVKCSKRLTYLHRLGSLTFDSRLCQSQLQAADIWAYESMRYIRDVTIKGEQPRWQFDRLTGGRANHIINVFDRRLGKATATLLLASGSLYVLVWFFSGVWEHAGKYTLDLFRSLSMPNVNDGATSAATFLLILIFYGLVIVAILFFRRSKAI